MVQKEQQSLLVYVVLGLIIGFGLDGLFYQKITYVYPYLWISSFALFFALAFDFRHPVRILLTSALTAAMACSPFLLMSPDSTRLDNLNLGLAVIFFPYALMIAHSFHFAYHLDSQIRVRYTSLFYAVWNTIPLLIIAGIFSTIAKLLIMLTGAIFAAFNFKVISQFLFSNHHFWIISNICLFITGIGIARQNLTILDSFRFVILKLFYYLYPFLAVISLLYLVLYGYTAMVNSTPESSTVIFIALSILGIIFFNAIFQDGEAQSYQSQGLRAFLRSHRIMLLLITVISAYLLYPESKHAINALLMLAILVLYGVFYGASALLPGTRSKQLIKIANVSIAIFYLFSYLIINNPFYPIMIHTGSKSWGSDMFNNREKMVYQQQLPVLKKLLTQQDIKLKHLGLAWQDSSDDLTPVDNICRADVKPYGWITGQIVNRRCRVVSTSKSVEAAKYQILTGNKSILMWGTLENSVPIALGAEIVNVNRVKPQSLCRVKYRANYKVGTLQNNYCIVPKQNLTTYVYSNFEIFTIDAKNYPKEMSIFLDEQLKMTGLKFVSPPAQNPFIAGVNDKGNTGICRGVYQDGLQIGNYQNNQCIISYGGKTMSLQKYSVLDRLTSKPKVIWAPRQYRAIVKSDYNLVLGFEVITGGTLRTLEACRCIYNNIIHVGKVVNDRCNIAVGNQEQSIQNGLYTSLQPADD